MKRRQVDIFYHDEPSTVHAEVDSKTTGEFEYNELGVLLRGILNLLRVTDVDITEWPADAP